MLYLSCGDARARLVGKAIKSPHLLFIFNLDFSRGFFSRNFFIMKNTLQSRFRRILSVNAICLTALTANAAVTYDFSPTEIRQRQEPIDYDFVVGAFDGLFITFPGEALVNESKVTEITIENIYDGTPVNDATIYATGGPVAEMTVYGSTLLCGYNGNPYYFRVTFPEGLFGDLEYYESAFTSGHANPQFSFETTGFGEPARVPELTMGEYKLICPSNGYNFYFEPVDNGISGEHQYSYTYEYEVDRFDNVGFYIEYSQLTDMVYKAGNLIGNDSETQTVDENGAFSYNIYTTQSGEQTPLMRIGDYDYIESVEFRLTFDGSGQILDITGVGRYNDPVVDDYVTFSIVLPGGVVSQQVKPSVNYDFFVTPDEGWEISTCLIGDTDVTSSVAADGRLTINIAEPAALSVVYKKQGESRTATLDASSLKVLSRYGMAEILGKSADTTVAVHTFDGRCVYLGTDSRIPLAPGAYLLTVSSLTFKLAVL